MPDGRSRRARDEMEGFTHWRRRRQRERSSGSQAASLAPRRLRPTPNKIVAPTGMARITARRKTLPGIAMGGHRPSKVPVCIEETGVRNCAERR
eukprot:scaffold9927_cov118-Isochrysis_galbana.AAC.1